MCRCTFSFLEEATAAGPSPLPDCQRTPHPAWVPRGGSEEEALKEHAAEVIQGKLVGQQCQVPREQVEKDVTEGQVTEGFHCRHSRRQLAHDPTPLPPDPGGMGGQHSTSEDGARFP